MKTGDELKAEGIARALEHASPPWSALFDQELLRLARSGSVFTSEDVTSWAGQPPDDHSPNAVGARMNAASRRGIIKRVGFRKADRVNQHSALVSEWIGQPVANAMPAPPPRNAPVKVEPIVIGPRWECTGCSSQVSEPAASLDPNYGMASCFTCGGSTIARRRLA